MKNWYSILTRGRYAWLGKSLKLMKLTFLLVLLSTMLVSAKTFSQEANLNLDYQNITIGQLFQIIEGQSDYRFAYSQSNLNPDQKVSINVKNQKLDEVLNNVLDKDNLTYKIDDKYVVITNKDAAANTAKEAAPKQIKVTGMVTSPNGDPIPGATVMVKGTSSGTITDSDGKFVLENVSGNATLVFSFIGMASQEVPVNNQTTINVVLKEKSIGLGEVVAVGYGVQKKSVVTGSISVVNSKDVSDKTYTRVDDALQGLTSGVTVAASSGAPGAAPTVRIRGTTSINNSDPLYVVDGVVMNGGIEYLNPNDIQSMEVLKDAASASIYGSRASNGVILITTKKGKYDSPLRVNFAMKTGIQGPIKKVKLTDASQYAMLRNEAVMNDGGSAIFADPSSFGVGTNWQDQIFSNNAAYQDYNLNISGGTDNATYFVSMGYTDQNGIVAPSIAYNKKFSLTTNTSFKINKYVKIGENLSYTYGKNQTGLNTNSEFGGPLSSALNLDPITPVFADAATASGYNQYAVTDGNGNYYGISNYVAQEITNPLADIQTKKGNYWYSHNMVGNAYLEITPIKDLKFRSSINAKKAFWGNESFTPLYYLNASTSNTSNTSQYRENDQNLTWNWDNTLTYSHKWGKHNFSALVGTSAEKQTGRGLNVNYIGEPATSFSNASFNYSLSAANRVGSGYENQDYALQSYFSRLTYDYNEKYLFTGVIRRDGSSRFGSNTRYGIFPSASVGWVISRENFFPQNSFVNNLKLRASYGVVGNEMSLADFAFESLVVGGSNYVLGNDNLRIGYATNRPANPDLKWEETHSTDLGFDAVLFKSFDVTFDAYKKTTKGMLQTVQLPSYAGFTSAPYGNVGDMENKGLELELGYTKVWNDFKMNVSGNISYLKNQVTYLGADKQYLDGGSTLQSSTYPLTRTAVGHAIGSFYGFKSLGVFHSQQEIDNYKYADGTLIQPNAKPGDMKWQDTDGQGGITADDRTWLGDPTPNWTYGLSVGLNWKNWEFQVFGQGVWGNQIFQGYRRLDIPTANYPIEALNAWTISNPNSNYPRLTDADPNHNFNNPSDFYLQNGAYFRIKSIQIGYNLPKIWAKTAGLKNARVYVSSSNLLTITKYNGYDPEIGGSSYGIDRGIYPQSRTLMFGLNLGL